MNGCESKLDVDLQLYLYYAPHPGDHLQALPRPIVQNLLMLDGSPYHYHEGRAGAIDTAAATISTVLHNVLLYPPWI